MKSVVYIVSAAVLVLAAIVALFIVKSRKAKKIQLEQEEKTTTLPVTGETDGSVPARHLVTIGNAQHVGSRKDQQDSFGISSIDDNVVSERGVLAVVADGMGGLNNGGVLSKAAVRAALRSFQNEPAEKNDEMLLLRTLKRAKDAVADTGVTDGGTTFIAVLIHNRQLHFVSVGDSRISLMRNGGLIQLNREHVYGRELDDLVLNGSLSEQEAALDKQRAALTSYLGKSGDITIDRNINPIPLFNGDKIILMSDGVYGYLTENELTELLMNEPMAAAAAVQNALVAKQNPSQDNLPIVILEV